MLNNNLASILYAMAKCSFFFNFLSCVNNTLFCHNTFQEKQGQGQTSYVVKVKIQKRLSHTYHFFSLSLSTSPNALVTLKAVLNQLNVYSFQETWFYAQYHIKELTVSGFFRGVICCCLSNKHFSRDELDAMNFDT